MILSCKWNGLYWSNTPKLKFEYSLIFNPNSFKNPDWKSFKIIYIYHTNDKSIWFSLMAIEPILYQTSFTMYCGDFFLIIENKKFNSK